MARKTAFQQSVEDAQRRARRKVQRLEKKGVHTSGINPIKDPSQMTTAERRAYKNQLEKFISRETRYVAGYEGTPISYKTVREIRSAERELNKKREQLWKGVKDKSVLMDGASMTAAQWREMGQVFDPKSGRFIPNPKSPLYFTEARQRDIAYLKGERDAREYIKKLKHAGTKTYEAKKNKTLRDNAARAVEAINEPELAARIRKLTTAQLYELLTRSDFVESVFMYGGGVEAVQQVHGVAQHLNNLIDKVVAK